MESQMDSTYEDSVFEEGADSPKINEQNPTDNINDTKDKNDVNSSNEDDEKYDNNKYNSKTFEDDDDTTSAVIDTTLERSTALPDNNDTKDDNIKPERDDDKIIDNKQNIRHKRDEDQASIKSSKGAQRAMDAFVILSQAIAANARTGSERKASSKRKKVAYSQDTYDAPQSRYLRQDTELDSLCSTEFEIKDVNNPEQTYFSSGFPSLLSYLGPNATNRTAKPKKKKQIPIDTMINTLPKTNKEHMSFAQEMRRRNESQWMRIEAVAKEKMDMYERYAVGMTMKIKRQREQINRRSQELMNSLASMEERKREEKLYDSTHGRQWRHHRSMQRRVLNLEPMSSRDKGFMSGSVKSNVHFDE